MEIKFKAWDKNEKKMINVFSVSKYHITGYYTEDIKEEAMFQVPISAVELLPYIGLKDKNDVEIYKGYILGYSNDSNGIIIWDNISSSFRLKFSDNDRVMISLQIGDKGQAVVIGNIYESPGLLKEKFND